MGALDVSGFAAALGVGLGTVAVLFGDDAAGRLGARAQRALLAAASLFAALVLGFEIKLAHAAAKFPPRWDFLSFFLHGHVALGEHAVYDPAAYARAFAIYHTPDALADPGFIRVVIDGALPYPPTTIPLFAWLGTIANYHLAAALWYALLLLALTVAAAVFSRTFLSSGGALGFALAIGLLGVSHGVLHDLTLAQTIPLVLLGVVGAFAARRSEGAWLALAIVAKPFTVLLLVVPLLARRFGALALALGGLGLAFLAALAIVGPSAISGYAGAAPLARQPPIAYMESINLSLSAVLLRALHPVPPAAMSLSLELPFLIAGGALALATLAAAARACARGSSDVAAAAVLLAALLLFPQTLTFYTALVLAPLGVVWRRRDELPVAPLGVALGAGSIEASLATDDGTIAFAVLLVLWCAAAVWAFGPLAPREPQRRASHPRKAATGVVAC